MNICCIKSQPALIREGFIVSNDSTDECPRHYWGRAPRYFCVSGSIAGRTRGYSRTASIDNSVATCVPVCAVDAMQFVTVPLTTFMSVFTMWPSRTWSTSEAMFIRTLLATSKRHRNVVSNRNSQWPTIRHLQTILTDQKEQVRSLFLY